MNVFFKLYGLLVRLASKLQSLFLLAIRLYWGWQFFWNTGLGKLMNIEARAVQFKEWGIPMPKFNVIMAGGTECIGGLLLLLGLGSRLVSIPLAGTMVVAYLTVHVESVKTIFTDPDTFVTQAPFLFLLAALIILIFGPGAFSLDHLIWKLRGDRKT